MSYMKKVVISGMLGNGLEWYDFAIYGQMAAIIGHLFFPPGNPSAQLLASFGVFAVGFVFRPLGAVLFGYIGDKYGRRISLVIAILMMAIPTGCIGLLPTYAQIGIWAPVLLTIIRIFQGLSLGGEFSGSIAYIVEHAPPRRRGLAGSASLVSLVLGFLLGTATALATVHFLPEAEFLSWGWRMPFLFGIMIGLIGLYIRRSCTESPAYEEAKEGGHLSASPLREALTHYPKPMLIAFASYLTVTMPFYLTSIYFISFTDTRLGLGRTNAFIINFSAMSMMLAGMLIGAILSDRVGRKRVMMPAAALMFLAAYPLFALMDGGDFTRVLLLQMGFGLLVGVYVGPIAALLVELFPTSVRYTGMAISYNISAAAFGGTTPFVCEWLIRQTGTPNAIAFYVMLCCVCSLLALSRYRDRWREQVP